MALQLIHIIIEITSRTEACVVFQTDGEHYHISGSLKPRAVKSRWTEPATPTAMWR